MVNKVDALHEGRAKNVYWTSDRDKVWVEFKDDIISFDGEKRDVIEGKGAVNAAISILLFEFLEKERIPTHYVEPLGPQDILAEALNMVPVRFTVRNITAGSLAKRMGVKEGITLKTPVLEYYYNNHELNDPMINEYHIEAFDLADIGELRTIKGYCFDINQVLTYKFSDIGLTLVDINLEFGMDKYGQVVLADEISPDTCRLWDVETGQNMDKDLLISDKDRLMEAYNEVLKRLQEDLG